MPLSIEELSRRFRVSRTRVLRLIRDAESAGLLSRTGERGEHIVFGAALNDSLNGFVAASFQHVALCAWARHARGLSR